MVFSCSNLRRSSLALWRWRVISLFLRRVVVYVVLNRGNTPLSFGLLLLLELDFELFYGVLTLGFLHAHMPFCLVSCGGL